MFKIKARETIAGEVYSMEIEAPAVADAAHPGHHVAIHIAPDGAALTVPISGYDRANGTITIVHRAQDLPSVQLSMLREGDELHLVDGPLGGACTFGEAGKVLLIAEDLGVASLLIRAREYKALGAYTICVLGFETHEEVFWVEEYATVCDELYTCTRDGSYGVSGRVTTPVRAVCDTHKDIERIVMIGRLDRMKKVAKVAADYDIPTVMSFDAIRQPAGDTTIFNGDKTPQEEFGFAKAPEIDANDIDFEKLLQRQRELHKASENTATTGT